MSGIALILAAHGSHISANTAGIVWGYVDRLRRLGVADEVSACFWKEPPAFSQVLDTVIADEVVVVPVFTAQGYFTQQVLPSEMGLDGALTVRGQRRIHLTPTIGEHKLLDAIVDQRLHDTISCHDLPPNETAAVIIGHGTRRNRHSREAARRQADRLRRLDWLGEVVAVYLDDEPDIPSIYDSTAAENLIALPYFLAEGSHVTRDVPRALGISGRHTPETVRDRLVYYCEPVGPDESIRQVILKLARDTGLPFEAREGIGKWAGFPAAGKDELMQALSTEACLQFGPLLVSRERVRHAESAADSRAFTSPAALRAYLRDQPFRPLPTRADLPAGWHVDLAQPQEAQAVLETIYPGLVADWAAQKRGTLVIDTLQAIGTRQDGMFKDIHKLPRNIINQAVDKICGNCVCHPNWWRDSRVAGGGLPCRSACNFWLSTARKMGDAVA